MFGIFSFIENQLFMTPKHIGIIFTIIGTILLALSVKVKRQYKGEMAKTIERLKKENNLMELTETFIVRKLFWIGLICIAAGSMLQW